MNPKLRRLAPGSLVAGLIWMGMSAPLSCANSTPPPGPTHDAGHHGKKDASTNSEAGCGSIGEVCCAPPTQCDIGGFCSPLDGTCKDQHPADIGQPCSSPSSCSSGICGYTQGISDGSTPVPDGNGTPPPQPTGCTVGCYNTTPDCTPGWTCQQLTVGEGLCVCAWSPEICDLQDNNCDGIIDNEPEADNYCTMMAEGIPQKCAMGVCECVTMCASTCVDTNTDNSNCGMCGKACKPTVEKCQGGTCACAYTECSGECVNTGGSDPMNCGNCGKVCDYTCANGSCGPVTLASGFNSVGSIAVDSTNVYWLIEGSSFKTQVDYCPIAGCGSTPGTLAVAVSGTYGGAQTSQGIALTSTQVYFSVEDYDVEQTPITGGTGIGVSFSPSSSYTTYLAADGVNLYWASTSYDAVYSCAQGTSCGSPTLIASTASVGQPTTIAVSGPNVYFGARSYSYYGGGGSGIFSAPTSGSGTITSVCTLPAYSFGSLTGLVVAGTDLYFSDTYSTIYTCPLSAGGAAATVYYTDPSEPETLATDGVNLYWGVYGYPTSSIKKCALGSTCASPTSLVTGISSPSSIAVGAKDIFWTSYGTLSGTVMKFSK